MRVRIEDEIIQKALIAQQYQVDRFEWLFLLAAWRSWVKRCAGCSWLLLDGSRNRTRRWCEMRVCGNRAKARRHYERQRKKEGG